MKSYECCAAPKKGSFPKIHLRNNHGGDWMRKQVPRVTPRTVENREKNPSWRAGSVSNQVSIPLCGCGVFTMPAWQDLVTTMDTGYCLSPIILLNIQLSIAVFPPTCTIVCLAVRGSLLHTLLDMVSLRTMHPSLRVPGFLIHRVTIYDSSLSWR